MGDPCDIGRLPPWLRKGAGEAASTHAMKKRLRVRGLHTVCEEARCPNLGECFARGTAAIMIMGAACTRACRFCAVGTGILAPLNPMEPSRVAEQVREMGLGHVVITSVTRDDLADGGAAHFAATVSAVRERCPAAIEVLTPDFEGREGDIRTVCSAAPDIFNHNVETVERLSPSIRDRASYGRSLEVLAVAKALMSGGLIKSGLMVGLGESDEEVEDTIIDLAKIGCDVVTIGQYLRPTKANMPVARYVEPEIFRKYEAMGLKHGIKHMFCGPFVRSSYLADKALL
ncbi:MAG: lipoyl synthase [Proteobacteria bacterium]|nr:lipoyl synthase [Pseudomonadota bacterium]